MAQRPSDPLTGPSGVLLKFCGAALFGGLVSLPVFLILLHTLPLSALSLWIHIVWIIPIVWGLLGIFHFPKMLDLAREFIESFLSHH